MDSTRVFFVFMGFMAAGFLLLVYNRANPHGDANYSIMLSSNQSNAYVRENCIKAAQDKVGTPLYLPTETRNDGASHVEMVWQATKDNPHTVVCRYEQGKGVSEVKIDGASIGAVSIDTGLGEAGRPSPGLKHPGH